MDLALARRLEADGVYGNQLIAQVWPRVNPQSELDVLSLENVIAMYGGPEFSINEAVGLGMEGPMQPEVLDQIEAFYHQRGHAAVLRMCPLADASLMEQVMQRGYRLTELTSRWVLELAKWQSPLEQKDPRVSALDAQDERAVLKWSQTLASGFMDTESVGEGQSLTLERAFCAIPVGTPVWAHVDGTPAAAGMLAMSEGVAALFSTSTRPSFRGRGLQTGLLDWRLRQAQGAGMELATIETDPGTVSARNVERMGFRLAYMIVKLELPVPTLNR
ncbi:MAG: GNAT family N-acetyltransferase [Firmicutes bacterium]|nr:GNAT family N-acetyltransferase [Bacillota bacterium]